MWGEERRESVCVRERERDKERERERKRDRHRDSDIITSSHTHTLKQIDRQTDRQRDRQTDRRGRATFMDTVSFLSSTYPRDCSRESRCWKLEKSERLSSERW